MGPSIFDRIRSLFTSPFLLEVAELSPYYVGAILLVSKFWDAVNDPMIGHLSDHTQSRWGRRRSWLLYSTIPLAASWLMLWWVPPVSYNLLGVYYLVGLLLFETFSSGITIPHNCLMAELASGHDDATSLSQYRYFGAILAGTIASMTHSYLLDIVDNERDAYLMSSFIWSAVSIPPILITVFYVREKNKKAQSCKCSGLADVWQEPTAANSATGQSRTFFLLTRFYYGLREIFKYKAYLIATFMCMSTLALEFVASNQVLYIKYVLKESRSIVFWVILFQTIGRLLAVPMWTRVSYRIGKKRTILVGMWALVLVQSAFFFLGEKDTIAFYILTPLRGACGVCPVLIIFSMVSDVVDMDELQHGQRREGIFYSFLIFFQKLSISAALSVSSFVLGAAGYEAPERGEEDNQPDSVLLALRMMSSFVPAFIIAVGALAGHFYPITREVHAQIISDLEEKRRKEAEQKSKYVMPDGSLPNLGDSNYGVTKACCENCARELPKSALAQKPTATSNSPTQGGTQQQQEGLSSSSTKSPANSESNSVISQDEAIVGQVVLVIDDQTSPQ
eukprot:TRINITY_DN5796_c0_g2_i1.p1 TRINITY_DN5796_c0_g2~~TRINITY_DN5796_c0_g2_i1.p1  ORF type:complete len:643 (+),score=138.44 TRINITY_DN5796_c0_g2_i1:242-1930(+)